MLSIVRWHVWLPEGTWVNAKRASLQFFLVFTVGSAELFSWKAFIYYCVYIYRGPKRVKSTLDEIEKMEHENTEYMYF